MQKAISQNNEKECDTVIPNWLKLFWNLSSIDEDMNSIVDIEVLNVIDKIQTHFTVIDLVLILKINSQLMRVWISCYLVHNNLVIMLRNNVQSMNICFGYLCFCFQNSFDSWSNW